MNNTTPRSISEPRMRPHPNHRCVAAALAISLLLGLPLLLIGCEREDSPTNSKIKRDAGNVAPTALDTPEPFRIVSLSPALSDMLIDLGLDGYIVGRDAWDEQLDAHVPRVGDLSNLDVESMVRLQPSDVILQARKRGAPTALMRLADERGWNVINVQIDGLDDVRAALVELVDQMSFGQSDSLQRAASERRDAILDQFDNVTRPLGARTTARLQSVMLLYSADPIGAFGPGSYFSDILVRLGGTNAIETGGAWQELDAESVVAINPWALVIVRTGPRTDTGVIREPLPLDRLGLDAIESHRVYAVSHPQALLPGTCLIEVAQELRAVLSDLSGADDTPEDAQLKDTGNRDDEEPTH